MLFVVVLYCDGVRQWWCDFVVSVSSAYLDKCFLLPTKPYRFICVIKTHDECRYALKTENRTQRKISSLSLSLTRSLSLLFSLPMCVALIDDSACRRTENKIYMCMRITVPLLKLRSPFQSTLHTFFILIPHFFSLALVILFFDFSSHIAATAPAPHRRYL